MVFKYISLLFATALAKSTLEIEIVETQDLIALYEEKIALMS